MIKNAYVFLDHESAAIENLMVQGESELWSDESVDEIRSNIKKHYIKEQQYRCCYCNQWLLSDHGRVWDAEHVLARKDYRQFTFETKNLAVACVDCNIAKGAKPVL